MDFRSKQAGLTRQESRSPHKGEKGEPLNPPKSQKDLRKEQEEVVEVEEGSGIDEAAEGRSWKDFLKPKGEDDG